MNICHCNKLSLLTERFLMTFQCSEKCTSFYEFLKECIGNTEIVNFNILLVNKYTLKYKHYKTNSSLLVKFSLCFIIIVYLIGFYILQTKDKPKLFIY